MTKNNKVNFPQNNPAVNSSGINHPVLYPKDYWEMLDNKIQQEGAWIQQRMAWLATFQGLLFASFGLIYSDGNSAGLCEDRLIILVMIAFVGMFTCVFIMAGLKGADKVLTEISTEWERLVLNKKTRDMFPRVGTDKHSLLLGKMSSWGPSCLFFIIWAVVIVVILR